MLNVINYTTIGKILEGQDCC